jgi:integrase
VTPAKRRQYGTGSVYQRKSDGRWIGTIQAGWTATGGRRVITVSCTADKGEAECKRLLRIKQNEIARSGLPVEGVGARATVKTWAETWLTRTQREVRPKSWATTRSAINKWVVPTIGRKRLDQLTPGDVRAVTDAIRDAGLTSSTALRAHRVLLQMLHAAIAEGHAVPARVVEVKAPGKSVSDRGAVALDDAKALLHAAAGLPDETRWASALLQGLRQGECLGLTWDCVDLAAGTLDVSWQLQALPYVSGRSGPLRVPDGYEYRQLDGNLCLVRPKSKAGWRVIPLVPWMVQTLTLWRQIAPSSPHGLVWPRPDGRPQKAKDDLAAWKALQVKAHVTGPGRPWHLHEARHGTATLLLEQGTDPSIVTAIMGHSSILTSRGYQHVSQDLARAALDRIADRLQLGAKA